MRRLALLLLWLVAGPASATSIVATTGAVTEVTAPASVVEEAFESDTEIRAFVERSAFVLPSDVDVDVTAPGTYPASPGTSVVAAGTEVDSYLLHLDIVDGTDGGALAPVVLSGSLRFDSIIAGVIGLDAKLDASDGFLGAPGTTYPVGVSARGFWEVPDSLTLSADRRTLTIGAMQVHNDFTDQIRVLVLAPEPTTGSLLLLGLVVLAARRRY